jgi:anti-sigma regulatory factor (Ser/Thr protein kinase)
MVRKALCITRDRSLALQVRQTIRLCTGGLEVIPSPDALDLERYQDADVLLLDAALVYESPDIRLPLAGRDISCVLIGATQLNSALTRQLEQPWCSHVLGRGPGLDAPELLTTLWKIRSSDVFGLEKYLPWGAVCYEEEVGSYEEKRDVVAWLGSTARRVGCTRRVASQVELAGDELLTNAIYPPHAESGRRFAEEAVKPAIIQWACSGRAIHIAVRDSRGTFRKEALVSSMWAATEAPPPTLTQLGVRTLLSVARRFVVNVLPGRLSEVVLSVDIDPTLSRTQRLAPSVGYFSVDRLQEAPRSSPGERRRHDRISIDLEGSLTLAGSGQEARVSIVDISLNGARLALEMPWPAELPPLAPGQQLELFIHFAVHGGLRSPCRVVRLVSQSAELAVSFDSLGPKDRELLLRLIEGQIGR